MRYEASLGEYPDRWQRLIDLQDHARFCITAKYRSASKAIKACRWSIANMTRLTASKSAHFLSSKSQVFVPIDSETSRP